MKKGFFILLFVVVLHSNSSWSQANLLNAKVPQEVGMKVVEDQSPIAYSRKNNQNKPSRCFCIR